MGGRLFYKKPVKLPGFTITPVSTALIHGGELDEGPFSSLDDENL